MVFPEIEGGVRQSDGANTGDKISILWSSGIENVTRSKKNEK